MFYRGLKRIDRGIDITLKDNPGHVLSPESYEIDLKVRFKKIELSVYRDYYIKLLAQRWKTRKNEFITLAKKGIDKDIKLLCSCGKKEKGCHAQYASEFMNQIVKRIKK